MGARPKVGERAKLMLAASIGVTASLYAIPAGRYLAYPLMLLSTLAHELGHGVAALTVGGHFHRFVMWADGSGMATWSGDVGRLARAWVAAGGLIGPACVAAVGFAAARTARGARHCLYAFGAFLALALILVVRNPFGALFVVVLISLGWMVAKASRGEAAQLVLIFVSVQLALSVFSRGDYLFTATARTSGGLMPSDVGQIAQALFLPYWFWGAICGAVSLIVLSFGVRAFWR